VSPEPRLEPDLAVVESPSGTKKLLRRRNGRWAVVMAAGSREEMDLKLAAAGLAVDWDDGWTWTKWLRTDSRHGVRKL